MGLSKVKTTIFMMKYSLLIFFILIFSCKNQSPEQDKDIQQLPPTPVTTVKTQILKETVFYYDILSNGKLTAARKADLYFQNNGESIFNISIKNGQYVKEGQLLAEQEKFKLETILKQNEVQLKQAHIELQDLLIARGYDLSDSISIPTKIMQTICLRSGYDRATIDYRQALYNYEAAKLYAPFNGIIANLYTTVGNLPTPSVPFCTIIDNTLFDVNFTIIENELNIVDLGDKVIVESFSADGIKTEGFISEINPIVESSGLVKVKARVKNIQSSFFEGMNVKIKIRKTLEKAIVIPKSALVLRDNRQVVFSVKNDIAQWHYVNTGLENNDSYTLLTNGDNNTLFPEEHIIIDGNINLAHESPVVINND